MITLQSVGVGAHSVNTTKTVCCMYMGIVHFQTFISFAHWKSSCLQLLSVCADIEPNFINLWIFDKVFYAVLGENHEKHTVYMLLSLPLCSSRSNTAGGIATVHEICSTLCMFLIFIRPKSNFYIFSLCLLFSCLRESEFLCWSW